jgi:sensor histidine kinase YesM
LKKREDFAISLRKKKHTEIIQTKRRSNMQKAFERTVVASSLQDGDGKHLGAENSMEIIDVNHLKDVI